MTDEKAVLLPSEHTKMTHLCLRLYDSFRTPRMQRDTHTYELLTNGVAIVTVPHTAAPSGGHLSRVKHMHWRPAPNTWWQETEQHMNHKIVQEFMNNRSPPCFAVMHYISLFWSKRRIIWSPKLRQKPLFWGKQALKTYKTNNTAYTLYLTKLEQGKILNLYKSQKEDISIEKLLLSVK